MEDVLFLPAFWVTGTPDPKALISRSSLAKSWAFQSPAQAIISSWPSPTGRSGESIREAHLRKLALRQSRLAPGWKWVSSYRSRLVSRLVSFTVFAGRRQLLKWPRLYLTSASLARVNCFGRLSPIIFDSVLFPGYPRSHGSEGSKFCGSTPLLSCKILFQTFKRSSLINLRYHHTVKRLFLFLPK